MLTLYHRMESIMRSLSTVFLSLSLSLVTQLAIGAASCPAPPCAGCCVNMGGIKYCDSSAGRYVCENGYYSSCYCTRHAVMDLQKIQGCCLWQGGVFKVDELGLVVCNNGGVSDVCNLQTPVETYAAW